MLLLQKYTTFDKATRGHYADLFVDRGVDNITSFLTPLTYSTNYLVETFQMPRAHSDAIYQALQQLASEACSATNQVEVVKSLKKQKETWEMKENSALAVVNESRSVLSRNEELEFMAREDVLSRSLLVESHLHDIKQRNRAHEASRATEEGTNIEMFDDYRIRVRNEKEFINYRELQSQRRAQLVDMVIHVDNIVPAGVYVRFVSEKVSRYFAGLPVDKFSYEELKCTKQEVLEDAAAVFVMLNRLMTSAGGFATFQAELLHAGLLMHIMGLVHSCSRCSESVRMIKSEEYREEYCSVPPVITDNNHYVCTAIESGLQCIGLACRPARYSREHLNVDNITLLTASGIIPVIITAISSNIHVESIVYSAVACLSTVTCISTGFSSDVVQPLSGTAAEKSLTPSRAEHVRVVLDLLTCLAQVLQQYAHCPGIVAYCAEVLVSTLTFDIIVELGACSLLPDGTSTGIVTVKRIFKLLVKCCKLLRDYDQRSAEWLLYCLVTFTILHNDRRQSAHCNAVNELVTECLGRAGLCATIVSACPAHLPQQSLLELAFVLLGNLAANNTNNVFLLYDAGAAAVTVSVIRDHYLTDVRVASAGYYLLDQLLCNIASNSSDFLLSLQRSLIQTLLDNGLCETILFPCTLGGLREMRLRSDDGEEPDTRDLVDMYIAAFHVVTTLVRASDFHTHNRLVSIGICEKIIDVLRCHGRQRRALFEVCCEAIAALAAVNVALGTQTRFKKCGAPRVVYDLWLIFSDLQRSHEQGFAAVYWLSNEADVFDVVKEFISLGIKGFLTSERVWTDDLTPRAALLTQKTTYVSFLRDLRDHRLVEVHAAQTGGQVWKPVNLKQKLHLLYSVPAET